MKNPYYSLRDKELRRAERAFIKASTYQRLGEWYEFLVKYADHLDLNVKQERAAFKKIEARGKELERQHKSLIKDMKNATSR